MSSILPGFAAVESLRGGAGADTLVVQAGGSLAGSFDGAGTADAADLSALTAQALTVAALGGTDGFDVDRCDGCGVRPVEHQLAGWYGESDRLTGGTDASTWTVSALNAGTYADDGTGRALTVHRVRGHMTGGSGHRPLPIHDRQPDRRRGGRCRQRRAGRGRRRPDVHGHRSGRRHGCRPVRAAGSRGGEPPRWLRGRHFRLRGRRQLAGTVVGGAGADTLVGTDAGLTYTVTGRRRRHGFDDPPGRVHVGREPDGRCRGRHRSLHRGRLAHRHGRRRGRYGPPRRRRYGPHLHGDRRECRDRVGLLPAGFTGVENLQGGSATDTFAFGVGGSLTGTVNARCRGPTL